MVVAFIGAPVVGSIAGGVAVFLSAPGSAAMLGVYYFLFGSIFSCAAALLVGAPTLMLLRGRAKHVATYFVGISIVIALLIATAFQSALIGAPELPSVRVAMFAVVSAVVTAVLILRVHREAHAA
ncbi:hypothetical protein [Rhodoferax sp. OV413]|uniref:hypothetical protein n=1 Tax=Rhodoferax sp. OV413 TaxID=1855285 RepID=UPI00115F9421|nr:hypothetical protein [Rhodoferax sp. OV413]